MKCFISDDFYEPLSSNADEEDIRVKLTSLICTVT